MCFSTGSVLILILACITSVTATARPCLRQDFGSSSFVCMCNASYCDTVEPETQLPVGQFAVYTTSKQGARLQKTVLPFQKKTRTANIQLVVDPITPKQTILGFGGTFTDAAGMAISKLPAEAQEELINSYFSSSGVEYTLGRIPIASNDMSDSKYSYDFTPGDTGLAKFTIDGHDHLYKIPYIDKAVLASPHKVLLYGSPWAPPFWMKTNQDMSGYGTVSPGMAKVYANYLARFLSEYEGFMLHGRMWGLTTQSGPTRSCERDAKPEYQSLCWTAETMRNWLVKDLKQSVIDQGYPHIKIFTMDDNRDTLTNWSDTFHDPVSMKDIDGFAVQGYHDEQTPPDALCKTYNKYDGEKILLGSEFCIREKPVVELGSWERGVKLAKRINEDLENCMSGFTDYNLAVNKQGGLSWVKNYADSPIIVDEDKKVFYKQPMFYTIGQFSKFIYPNSTAIPVTLSGVVDDDVNPVVAFRRPDDACVVVVGNYKETQTTVEIDRLGGNAFVAKFTMEPNSINTVIAYKWF